MMASRGSNTANTARMPRGGYPTIEERKERSHSE